FDHRSRQTSMKQTQLAGYTLQQPLGSGGVGCVYKALSPTGEVVAVKVLHATAQSCALTRQRFRQEFEVAREVVHPHIVRYLDCGDEKGQLFLVMEYLEGVSLWEQVRQHGPMPEAEVVRLGRQVAQALDFSHRLNIVH